LPAHREKFPILNSPVPFINVFEYDYLYRYTNIDILMSIYWTLIYLCVLSLCFIEKDNATNPE